jgi:hypothetical protein
VGYSLSAEPERNVSHLEAADAQRFVAKTHDPAMDRWSRAN